MNLLFGLFGKIGNLLSGKKKTTTERLEQLDKEIKDFEKFKLKSESNEKKYIGALLLYSIIMYILGAIIYYIYLMPKNLSDRLKTLIPFLIIPLIIYLIRRFLKWFYIKRTANYAKKLIDLKEEKKNILEEVKEKETYKKAREILDRFSSDSNLSPPLSPSNDSSFLPSTPFGNKTSDPNASVFNPKNLNTTNLIHRNVRNIQNQQQINLQSLNKSTPNISDVNRQMLPKEAESKIFNATISSSNQPDLKQTNANQSFANQSQLPPPPSAMGLSQARTLLPRPIINPNRTFLDKLLDFMIGEGPNNRYALICKSCHFHNGMALKEEFEYVAFRCAYCLFYNEARKTKLSVPKSNNIKQQNNGVNNNTISQIDNNMNGNDSTMSSSNSFDDIGSEPISSVSNPQATSSKAFDKETKFVNVIKRKTSIVASALTDSNYARLNVRKTSKSMDMLNIERIRDDENKENDSADEFFSNEIETN